MAPLTFLNTRDFDCEAPTNQPHLIEMHTHPSCVDITELRLCDSVATLLHDVASTHPTALKEFFDFRRVREFALKTQIRVEDGEMTMAVSRVGRTVIVSVLYTDLKCMFVTFLLMGTV